MVGKPLQIAAPETAGIEMEQAGVGAGPLKSDPELCEKVIAQLAGNPGILFLNLVQSGGGI